LDFFIKNCTFLSGMTPNIAKRTIIACSKRLTDLDIDVKSKHPVIDWESFVTLYCLCETGNMDEDKLIEFWIRVRLFHF
jgi:hypothetical protein